MTIDVTTLPSELLVVPHPLIGFCGLDVARQSVHKTIWDAFSGSLQRKPADRERDRAAVQYKLLPANYEFPVAKPKRTSYEWYHPKGILKRNWMLKHLHVLPSVVVLFQDIEWNDSQWTEKQVQCAAIVQALKNALQERNTRLCLVLLQKSAPLPPGEDMLAAERAASLTSACGITSKMLFILPHTEHLMGYTLRLESAFLDMAQSYYALMSKRIRTHRDQLTAAHTTLKIRHQFKLGFVAEMRQDFSTAQKHYFQAYSNNLDEIRINDANCLEIKTVAGFLNYKLCRLMFKLKTPRDAIKQFIIHIEKFKTRVGFKDLAFEHHAWLSTQHAVFGELFYEAIKNGLPALQTQHPGIYFQKAAEYVIKRRQAAKESYETQLSANNGANAESTAANLYTEFFGVRAVKTGDPLAEQQANMLLSELERNFNYSASIIALLGQAMAQFKIYKCLRFRKKLAIDMAEEYLQSGDHAKALTLYSLMLPDYRQEQWSTIFSDVLLKTLRCALLSASVADYIACSIEALALRHQGEQKERVLLLENLWQVFQCVPPLPKAQLTPEVQALWSSSLASVKSPIPIDLDKINGVLQLCASFQQLQVNNNDVLQLQLIVRVLTDVPLRIRGFQVLLADVANPQQTYKLEALKYTCFANLLELRKQQQQTQPQQQQLQLYEKNMRLEPDCYYQLFCSTEASQFNENTQLSIMRLEALMGTDQLGAVLSCSANFARSPFRHHTRTRDLDDNLSINPICYIAPTFHLSTQTNLGHGVPDTATTTTTTTTMLVNEYYPVVTTISNMYNVYLQNVCVHISVPMELRNSVFLTTDVTSGRQKLHSQIQIDVGELSAQSSNNATYYIFSLLETEIKLQQRLSYTLDVERSAATANASVLESNSAETTPEHVKPVLGSSLAAISPVQIEYLDETRVRKSREDSLTLSCAGDFKFQARFYTLNRRPLSQIYRGENFLLRANMEVLAKEQLEILDSYFICDHNLVQSNYSFKRKKYSNKYCAGDQLENVIVLRTNATLQDWLTPRDMERTKLNDNKFISRLTPAPPAVLESISPAPNANKAQATKLPNTLTIINNNNLMSSSLQSEDGKLEESNNALDAPKSMRVVFNKALEAVQATGHCRGFIKGAYTLAATVNASSPTFGVFCIRWRRAGVKDENESKFIISGLHITEPPLNIYCTIEEKMFVKMPMAFKVVLKNPTPHVLHLIATLAISNTDNFICSGHKQVRKLHLEQHNLLVDVSKLQVGWQELPVLTLEYNTKADPQKNDSQNALLDELVQRALPKRVFVLPPLKQQSK
ncbi:trafficking protein particle complex subunit 11 [Drosophila busckii]|uniref:trafficking protein particle complex subunit 11 n=1 Tax=Drosophila busckii TaxID=30019 RepID=UPI001432A623|nr:trafficking protein particle complex subunit 11 [Drosophila busckii]